MTTLRKACRRCTAAKRKCIVQLPACTRCAQRGLECVYDLDHLSVPMHTHERISDFCTNLQDDDTDGVCLIKTLKSRSTTIDPAIGTPGQRLTRELIRLAFQSVPDSIKAGKPAAFVHPKLRLDPEHARHLAPFERLGSDAIILSDFAQLVRLDVRMMSIQETLTALQALVMYLATFLLSDTEPERTAAEGGLGVLNNWAQHLLMSAQTKMPHFRSSWQKWLYGESVRRTIVMAYGLYMAINNYRTGYCSNWVLLESLPFDRRPGLWMAQSPQAWIAAAKATSGEEVGEKLSSFHEFAEMLDGSSRDIYGDVFLFLIIFSHNGYRKTHARMSRRIS